MTLKRFSRQLALLGLLFIGATALAGAQWRPPAASAAPRGLELQPQGGGNRAGLVIRFDDSRVVTKCVTFTEPVIGGDDLLRRSGLVVGINPEGGVCSIDNQGCASDDCFCLCPFPNCQYWAYYHLSNGAWLYSQQGAAWFSVTNGAVEGWSWGEGDRTTGVPPPLYTFDQICNAAPLPNAPTVTATATVEIAPTATATVAATETQPAGAVAESPTVEGSQPGAPGVTFNAAVTNLGPNGCTLLTWSTSNATQVTLNGAPVALQGRQNVCPKASERYVLTASNSAGATTREVAVQISGSGPIPSAQLSPTSQPLPEQQTAQPAVGEQVASTGMQPALQPTVLDAPPSSPTPTVYYTLVAPPTSTPRPRRPLGADGQATPTPILLARSAASGPAGGAPALAAVTQVAGQGAGGPPMLAVESRVFSPSLLPGYAAFLLAAAALLAAGMWVIRRRGTSRSRH